MKRVTVYFNEHSSNASLLVWRKNLAEALFRYDVTFKTPISLDMLSTELKKDVKNGVDAIIGIGGDGTANRMAQEVAGHNIKVFFIPAGTANDLCNQLNVGGDANNLINIFKSAQTTHIDTITINDSCMLTNGGLGLPNIVAERINRYRHSVPGFKKVMKLLGGRVYSLMLGIELFVGSYKKYRFSVSGPELPIDGKELRCPMILVNNQAVLGNSFRIAPETSNTDGRFNVTIFTHKNKLSFLKCVVMVKILGIIPKESPDFIAFETNSIEIKALDSEMVFFGDGEQLVKSNHFNIGIKHQNMELISKKGSTSEESGISLDAVSRL